MSSSRLKSAVVFIFMNEFFKPIRLLSGYFKMYWLKPFDAVNDAANAQALLGFDWSKKPVLEVGGGDGVFSFIMHGGRFRFLNDRYGQTDLSLGGDIYDVYKKGNGLEVINPSAVRYDTGIDLKLSHLYKAGETGTYKHLVSSLPDKLALKANTFGTIFLYTFHGLTDYAASLKEIRRVIRNDGTLLMIAVNKTVRGSFVCFKLHEFFKAIGWKRLADYFARLDGGRQAEIGKIFSRSIREWYALLENNGFRVEEVYAQVSPLLWKIYDTQTRPFLRALIVFEQALEKIRLKRLFKLLWMCVWFPVAVFSYFLLARPKRIEGDNRAGVFLAIRASIAGG